MIDPARRSPHAPVILYLAVAAGSLLGGTARWLASEVLHAWLGAGFPWGTLFVNISGSFLIGWYAAVSAPFGRTAAKPIQRHFVMTGICGGYTTFSIFSLETVRLLENGNHGLALINVSVSTAGWLAAVWAGFALATRLTRPAG